MDTRATKLDTTGILTLSGRFDFSAHRDFRAGYQGLLDDQAIKDLLIDMNKVEYLDSSALGMLLLLKQRADELRKPVSIRCAPGTVRKVLDIANFGRLFPLS